MSDEEKIEKSLQDGETGNPEEVQDESQLVKREMSIVNENTLKEETVESTETNPTSNITTSEIKEMEVHHHPHVEKKNFKEYFLEFVMIFLAVTLGFFAENVREHFDEEKIASQYLGNFRQELLHNKNLYHFYDSVFALRTLTTDSLIKIFINKKENDDLKTSARLITNTRRVFVSTISKAAYDQMVNSGGLKYIDDATFRDSLTIYESLVYNFERYNEVIDDYRSGAFPDVSSIEPLYSMTPLFLGDTTAAISPFAELTQKERTEVLNFYNIYLARYVTDKNFTRRLNKTNDELIKMLDNILNK